MLPTIVVCKECSTVKEIDPGEELDCGNGCNGHFIEEVNWEDIIHRSDLESWAKCEILCILRQRGFLP